MILELGIFIGKLGRKRVCPLYFVGVELPSDIHGVLYVRYDQSGKWQPELVKELVAVGIAVDSKKLATATGNERTVESRSGRRNDDCSQGRPGQISSVNPSTLVTLSQTSSASNFFYFTS